MVRVKLLVSCLSKVVDAILPPLTTLAFSRNGKRPNERERERLKEGQSEAGDEEEAREYDG